MYSLDQIERGLYDPIKIAREINSQFHSRLGKRTTHPKSRKNIFEKDWDNLIILDACRYDVFSEVHDSYISGENNYNFSKKGGTTDFLKQNFHERKELDTVYINGNLQYYRMEQIEASLESELFKVVPAWNEIENNSNNNEGIPPDELTSIALREYRKYRDKRFIIHYMQPHTPYLGSAGKKYSEEHNEKLRPTRDNETSDKILKEAYKQNLEIVLNSVSKLVEEIKGLTVITADHGELLGERNYPIPIKEYNHKPNIYCDALHKVPWFTICNGNRRETKAEKQGKHRVFEEDLNEELAGDMITKQLRMLGYLEN